MLPLRYLDENGVAYASSDFDDNSSYSGRLFSHNDSPNCTLTIAPHSPQP